MKRRILLSLLFMMGALWVFFPPSSILSQDELWKKIDEGLFLGEMDSPKVTLIKIDPKYYSFKLMCATENNQLRMTPRKWSQKHNLLSAINAGMFQTDGITNVGYMKNFSHINSSRLNTSHKAVLAFNRVDATVPEIQIIDLKCQNFERLKEKYHTLIQGIRMVSCWQENVWEKQGRRWSIAAFAMDKTGNGLFTFAETPYSVHDFTHILLSLPISLYNAIYLEGGGEAALYLSANGIELEKVGSHETGLKEDGFPKIARPIPNVIGIAKKFDLGS